MTGGDVGPFDVGGEIDAHWLVMNKLLSKIVTGDLGGLRGFLVGFMKSWGGFCVGDGLADQKNSENTVSIFLWDRKYGSTEARIFELLVTPHIR